MGKRTTIVLAAVAAAMLAFIFLHERHTLSSRDMEGRHDRLLPEFVRDHVSRIEIAREGGRIALVHEREDEDDVLGEWHLAEPVEAPADEGTVESLLGSLEWAHARRTIQDIDDEDRERFGLADPVLQAWFTVKRERVHIRVGKEDPTEGGRYVQVGDATAVHVVGKDFTEALDQEAGHFRSKVLFPEWEAGDAQVLTVREGDDARELAIREERWWLRVPFEAWADHPRVEAALDATLGLKATRYAAEDPSEVDDHGLDGAAMEVRVRGGEGDGSGDTAWTAVLRVGAPCGTHEGERYAQAGEGPLVCVRDGDLDALRTPAATLRQAALITVREPELTFVGLERDGRKLELEGEDGELQFRAGEVEGEADASAVADWLRTLQRAPVAAFEPLEAGNAAQYGLSRPRATLTMQVREGGAETVLYMGDETPEGLWVRRGSEPFAARVDSAVAEAFDPSPVRFRPRRLISERDEAARRVLIDRGAITERIELGEGGWQIREPVDMAADRVAIRGLVRRLANLEAARFVAERPAPRHGLSSPRWTVTLRFEGSAPERDADPQEEGEQGPREYLLRIGAPAEGGAYAQTGSDAAVFVLPQVVVDDLASPLLDRDLLASARGDLAGIRIERGRRAVELTREGDAWQLADGTSPDRDRTRRLIDRLGALRATALTGYGPSGADHGLDDPRGRVTVRRAEGAAEPREYTFRIGATTGEGDAARTHVRREDVAAGLVFPPDVMASFLEYEP